MLIKIQFTHTEKIEKQKKMEMNNNNNLWNDWAREKKHNKTKFGQIVAKKTKYFSLLLLLSV